jgi:hypothetical protein
MDNMAIDTYTHNTGWNLSDTIFGYAMVGRQMHPPLPQSCSFQQTTM